MNIEEVIANSKLLRKALALGIIYTKEDGYYLFNRRQFVYCTYSPDKVWSHKKGYWMRIYSVVQVENSFKTGINQRED